MSMPGYFGGRMVRMRNRVLPALRKYRKLVKKRGQTMTVDEIIGQVTDICRKNHVEHLALFGSYAKGDATKYSDLDFIVYGPVDIEHLQEQGDEIMTLKKIDLFEYDLCQNRFLKEDMDKYARKIY